MLNSRLLTEEQRLVLKELRFSTDGMGEEDRKLPYQTKIDIFDKKCVTCGFSILRIKEVTNRALKEWAVYEFSSYQDFEDFLNKYSLVKNLIVERGCSFGIDPIKNLNNREPYWNVNEIVENTCDLWPDRIAPEPEHNLDDEFFQFYYGGAVLVAKMYGKFLPNETATDFKTEVLEAPIINGEPQMEPTSIRELIKKK